MIIQICCAILLPAVLGFLIISVILRNDRGTLLGERVGLSFPLGAGLLTLQMFLLGILRVPLTLFNTALPVCMELAALAIWIGRANIPVIPPPSSGLWTELTSRQNHWIKKIAFAILFLWIGTKLGSAFLETGLRPIYSWDAWTVWSAAAKVFYDAHSLLLDAAPHDFFGKSALHRIMVYPLHSNLIQVWMSLWIGSFDDVLVKFYNPVYFFSMAICFYYAALRETNRMTALALLVIVLSAPLLSYHAIEANSDLMLGVYFFLAASCFLKSVRGNPACWLLMGIFSAEALLTKQEAFFFIAPLILSAIAYLKFNAKSESGKFKYLLPLLMPFLTVIPWYVFTIHYGLAWSEMAKWADQLTAFSFGDDPNRISSHLTFHPEILSGYFYWLVSLNNFNVMIFFLPLLMLSQAKLSKESLHILFPIVCYMLFFMMVYMFTRYYAWFLLGTIFYRNVLTCYPAICLLILLLLKKSDSPDPAAIKLPDRC